MFHVKEMEYRILISMPEDLRLRLVKEAERLKLTQAELMRRTLDYGIRHRTAKSAASLRPKRGATIPVRQAA